MGQQVRIADIAPLHAGVQALPQAPGEQRTQWQPEQPQRSKKMKIIHEHDAPTGSRAALRAVYRPPSS